MLKPRLSRSLFTAIVLLLVVATSSALGAPRFRGETKRAARHHASPRRGRRSQRRSRGGSAAISKAIVSTPAGPLLGDEAVETQRDYLSAGEAEAFPFPARATGATGAAHVYVDSHNSAKSLTVGLYSNANGRPGSLLSTGSIPSPLAQAWNTVPISSTQLVSGSTYWLAVLGTGGTLHYRDRAHGSCPSETSTQANLLALPASWRTGAIYRDCPISAYVTAGIATFPVEETKSPLTPPSPTEPPAPIGPPAPPAPEPPVPPVLVEPPAPPAAPANSALPTIGGIAEEGKSLTATAGAWTGNPASYAYRWQDCNTSGEACTSISGATATSYTLSASDVGHTIRVVVTATNEGGSTAASSNATTLVVVDPPPPPPPPAPPTASFTYAPSSPVTGEPVTFDATGSECPDGPCTYTWSDDGSAIQPPTPLWPLGSGQTLQFTFSEAGTKYVRLVVTDTIGQTATIEHNVVVEAAAPPPPPPPPPPPAAPANTALPAVSGTTTEGQALSASTGAWTGSPTSYAYQWQDCNTSGEACTSISGATATSYTLSASDVGHTIRIVVTATNEGGSTAASSNATALVAAVPPPPPPPPPPPAAPTNSALPTVSGTPEEGHSLTATKGTWTGSPTSYAYQWQDCNTSGEACTSISSATATSYTLSASDVGHTIRVVVTATNEGGSTAASSNATTLVAAVPPPPPPPPPNEEGCTSTISSVSQINADLKPSAVVCLTAGTYGAISITTSPSSNATLTAAPGAHVVVNGVNIAASNITVSQLHSTGTINVGSGSPYPGFSHDVIEHNDVGPTNGYGISVMSATSTPSSYITIAYNRIHNTSDTSEGDALRFDGWNHLTVTGNDIYEIKECPSSTCHTDTLQSYQGDVPTEGLTIEKNYSHDNVGAQGLPFLKDGDISNVIIRDNLSLRNTPTDGQVTGIWIDENIHNLLIEKNTYWGTDGSIVQSEGSASNPTATIDRNVMDTLDIKTASAYSYAYTEDYDIFREAPWTFTIGSHSKVETSPTFMCSPKCGGGATSEDDYRLKSNPNGIGIDWSPAEEQYGPTN